MEVEDNFEKTKVSESKQNLIQINTTKDSINSISTEASLNNSSLSSTWSKILGATGADSRKINAVITFTFAHDSRNNKSRI